MTERSETQALIEEARAFIEENHDGGGDEGVFALLGRLVDALAASEARGEEMRCVAFGFSQIIGNCVHAECVEFASPLCHCTERLEAARRAQAALGKTEKEGKP